MFFFFKSGFYHLSTAVFSQRPDLKKGFPQIQRKFFLPARDHIFLMSFQWPIQSWVIRAAAASGYITEMIPVWKPCIMQCYCYELYAVKTLPHGWGGILIVKVSRHLQASGDNLSMLLLPCGHQLSHKSAGSIMLGDGERHRWGLKSLPTRIWFQILHSFLIRKSSTSLFSSWLGPSNPNDPRQEEDGL